MPSQPRLGLKQLDPIRMGGNLIAGQVPNPDNPTLTAARHQVLRDRDFATRQDYIAIGAKQQVPLAVNTNRVRSVDQFHSSRLTG